MNFLSKLQVYASKWTVTSEDKLSKDDLKAISEIEVVKSEYGLSACFHLTNGGKSYMAMSRDSQVEIGDTLDPKKVKVLTLSREGDEDIYKLEA